MRRKKRLIEDFFVILVSLFAAIWIAEGEIVTTVLAWTRNTGFVESFFAGMFFTSAFTTVPAMVVLGKIAQSTPVLLVAALAAAGATFGDLLIFQFVKDRLAEDIFYLLQLSRKERWVHVFHLRLFRRLMPFVGALIIASPLPDEIGLALMGLSKMKTPFFLGLTYIFNFIGVLLIGLVARGLL